MRNFYLLVMLSCAMAANALSISSSMSYWSTAELDGESEDLYGTLRVSDNGEYAVGYDGENIYTAYIWERATGELTFASEYTGSKREGASVLNDVSNNGKMVGATRASYTHEDGTTNTCWLPAFRYVDSDEYTVLPCPDYCVTKYPYDLDYNSFAYRVSPDGKVICGEMYLTDPILEKSRFEPYLWFLDDDDNVIDTQSFYGLEYGNQGVEIYDMSDDGSIIVGMVTSARGDFMPMYIMDGELHTLAGPDLVWSDDNNRWEQQDENGDYIDEEVWEGIASSIDGDGNIYYYNIDGQGQATYGIYNV